jgi:hypothetical protein
MFFQQRAPSKAASKSTAAAKKASDESDGKAKGAAVRHERGGTRGAGAERRERLLALILEKPGITVPELSEALNIDVHLCKALRTATSI